MLKIVLLGSNEEKPLMQQLLAVIDVKIKTEIIDMTGRLSIHQSAYFIEHSELLISNDSALVHIASCFETRLIVLFLSTVPEFGFAPPYKNAVNLSEPVACKPCDHKGKSYCPKKHFACAYLLSADKVMRSVEKLLYY